MGRKFKRKNRGGRGGGRGGGDAGGESNRPHRKSTSLLPGPDGRFSYPEIPKEHEILQRYYDTLFAFPDGEQAEFWTALRRELPSSFRFCGSKGHALAVRSLLQTRYVPEIEAMEHVDGRKIDPPGPVSWFPDQLAWSMTTPKKVVRRYEPFTAFQRFLVSETSVGNISRQELVSMIPPLLLDLKPGMVVLDMCAAPGSKASQLLEMIHTGEEARMRRFVTDLAAGDEQQQQQSSRAGPAADVGDVDVDYTIDNEDDGRATGLLIANDVEWKRSHMLVHQLKRLSSPNLIVTNHDAIMYPPLCLPPAATEEGKESDGDQTRPPTRPQWLRFDRVLADVPCSGDGTLRKNANLWKDWQPASSLGLHVTQVRILVRALQLLKVGGRVVYSTCSMNPIENEAVVVSAVERCGGLANVHLIDCTDRLPALRRVPGLRRWSVIDKSGRIFDSWAAVERHVRENDVAIPSRVTYSMFARPAGARCADVPLDRCLRVYPHHQDTGAFFIAVLEKQAEFKAMPEDELRRYVSSRTENTKGAAAADTAEEGEQGIDMEAQATEAANEEEEQGTIEEEVKSMILNEEEQEEGEDQQQPGAGEMVTSVTVRDKDQEPESTFDMAGEATKEELGDMDEAAKNEALLDDPPPVQGTKRPLDGEVPEPAAEQQEAKRAKIQEETAQARINNGQSGSSKRRAPTEEPYKFLSADDSTVSAVRDFYQLSDRFPRDRFMVRNGEGVPAKAIYYTSALVRDILTHNEERGVRFVHAGVKMFVRQDAPTKTACQWRIQSEGMRILEAYVGPDRIIRLTNREVLRTLLREMFPRLVDGGWARLGEIGEQLRDMSPGCCVLRFEPTADGGAADGFEERMAMPLWKSLASVNLMLPKEDRAAMLLRLWNDTTPLVNVRMEEKEKHGKSTEGGAEGEPEGGAEGEADGGAEGGAEGVAEVGRGADLDLEVEDVEDMATP